MNNPIVFPDVTSRFGLPNLYPGQAQKEFFINEATYLTDLLLHPAIEAEVSAPPADPETGKIWLVGQFATGEWQGQDGNLAVSENGGWRYISPVQGIRLFDKSTRQFLLMSDHWLRATPPISPSGGTTIDAELRLAFTNLIEALRNAGIFPVNE